MKIIIGILLVLLMIATGLVIFLAKEKLPVGSALKNAGTKMINGNESTSNTDDGQSVISEKDLEKRFEEMTAKVEAESDPEKKKAISAEEGARLFREMGIE